MKQTSNILIKWVNIRLNVMRHLARGTTEPVDKLFPTGSDSACRLSYRRTRLHCFCTSEFAPLRLRVRSVNVDVLCASISAYLMLGLLWTLAYWLVDQLNQQAFSFNTTSGTKETMAGSNA